MFVLGPTCASPRYVRCGTFVPSPMTDFFISTKFPARAPSLRCVPGRKRAKGPMMALSSRRLCTATQCGSTTTSSPRIMSLSTLPLRIVQRRPEFLQSEAVDAGIDFVELALLVAKLRFLDDGLNMGFGFAQDASVPAGIADYRA